MEIEELFCKKYPEYSVNGKPLHPYFDVFEEGYEQAERENEELRNNGFTVSAMTEQQLKVALEKGEQLEKENAEWEKFVKDIQNRNEENYLKVCHKLATELNRGIKLTEQLEQAKKIIKDLLFLVIASQIKTIESDEIKEQAKQFLKEIEK